MSPTRRTFVTAMAAATGSLTLRSRHSTAQPTAPASLPNAPRAQESLRVLILGGTGFLGPHMVRYATERGHSVTIFNRGRTNTHLFPDIEKLVGDRDGNLTALEGRTWDVVLDNSGYVPRHVHDSAQLLANAADHYLFTSTGGVYASWYSTDGTMKTQRGEPVWPEGGTTEDHPTVVLPEPDSEEVGKWYGHLKVLCEDAVRDAFGERCTITRPGLIVGPGDTTDRFTYYPVRINNGGEVIAFGGPDDPVQYIDSRDLAAWSVRCCEEKVNGTFNAVTPLHGLTMAEFVYGVRAITSSDVRVTWVPGSFLTEQGVPEASLMPWVSMDGPFHGAMQLRPDRAFAAGLTARPLADIARDTLAWWETLPHDRRAQMRGGLRGGDLGSGPASMEQQMALEAKILEAWARR